MCTNQLYIFFFSSRRRHTRFDCDWSSDVCSSDLLSRSGFLRPPMEPSRFAAASAPWTNHLLWKSSSLVPSGIWPSQPPRSEEHTSELQSQSNLVCRLLLEKKKNYILARRCSIRE